MPENHPSRGRVLVAEDEPYVRESLGAILRSRGYDIQLTANPEQALRVLTRTPVDVVLTDLKMPGGGGLDLIRKVHASSPEIPIVVLTGFGTIASAVECIREGATDYILKPADPDALEVALERAMKSRELAREVAYLRSATAPSEDDPPVGESPAWIKVMSMVRAAAPTDSTVLLLGESGTGKELIARLVHRLGARSERPYVRVNCAAVPLEMWESEFFGHRKGSYTGALADREGRFRLAHGGTLFMDEVGAMPLPAQAKILRVLQDGVFDRLGDEQPTRVDVRIIAATNSDLEADIASGRFRQDLYYRLNVIRIQIPALRERAEDIPPLARKFMSEVAARLGRTPPEIGQSLLAELMAYPWPGNVRELRNVIERAIILNPGKALTTLDLAPAQDPAAPAAGSPESELNLRGALGRREREVVMEAMRRAGGFRKEAARLLGIDQRNLGYYFRKHDINPDRLDE